MHQVVTAGAASAGPEIGSEHALSYVDSCRERTAFASPSMTSRRRISPSRKNRSAPAAVVLYGGATSPTSHGGEAARVALRIEEHAIGISSPSSVMVTGHPRHSSPVGGRIAGAQGTQIASTTPNGHARIESRRRSTRRIRPTEDEPRSGSPRRTGSRRLTRPTGALRG
jgi:hypothetical protein